MTAWIASLCRALGWLQLAMTSQAACVLCRRVRAISLVRGELLALPAPSARINRKYDTASRTVSKIQLSTWLVFMGKDAAMPNTWTELETEIRLALQPPFKLRGDLPAWPGCRAIDKIFLI